MPCTVLRPDASRTYTRTPRPLSDPIPLPVFYVDGYGALAVALAFSAAHSVNGAAGTSTTSVQRYGAADVEVETSTHRTTDRTCNRNDPRTHWRNQSSSFPLPLLLQSSTHRRSRGFTFQHAIKGSTENHLILIHECSFNWSHPWIQWKNTSCDFKKDGVEMVRFEDDPRTHIMQCTMITLRSGSLSTQNWTLSRAFNASSSLKWKVQFQSNFAWLSVTDRPDSCPREKGGVNFCYRLLTRSGTRLCCVRPKRGRRDPS